MNGNLCNGLYVNETVKNKGQQIYLDESNCQFLNEVMNPTTKQGYVVKTCRS